MGMLPSDIAVFACEQRMHSIRGTVLTLGQQAVFSTLDDVKQIIKACGVTMPPLKDGFDTRSKVGKESALWRSRTNAQTVLSLLGAAEVLVSDCSSYEGADFIIDLNLPVGDAYFEKFDVIMDLGTLEHVFNIPTALRNIAYMLKKGGDVVLVSPSNAIDHGFYSISPTLYFDFFAANNFSNFSCYLEEASGRMVFKGVPPRKTRIYKYLRYNSQIMLSSFLGVNTIFFATKNKNTGLNEIRVPIQSFYASNPLFASNPKDSHVAVKKNEAIDAEGVSILKRIYHDFIKPALPRYIKTVIFAIYAFFYNVRNKSPNLRYIGQVRCLCKPRMFRCHTKVGITVSRIP